MLRLRIGTIHEGAPWITDRLGNNAATTQVVILQCLLRAKFKAIFMQEKAYTKFNICQEEKPRRATRYLSYQITYDRYPMAYGFGKS
ncbi:MAG: hypothetical protein CSA21_04310 [Deltaproteobacteria bacterium]|nr:MAG: hypothetical protein CSA21_04310 [Deltaproteobacteria bacterium]